MASLTSRPMALFIESNLPRATLLQYQFHSHWHCHVIVLCCGTSVDLDNATLFLTPARPVSIAKFINTHANGPRIYGKRTFSMKQWHDRTLCCAHFHPWIQDSDHWAVSHHTINHQHVTLLIDTRNWLSVAVHVDSLATSVASYRWSILLISCLLIRSESFSWIFRTIRGAA